ncbi:MAG TPA: CotH kinase family protein, partial [Gemmataceae bacterium]
MLRFALLAWLLAAVPSRAVSQDSAAKLLDTAKVWKVELRLSAENWQAMQPKGGGPPGFGPGGPMRPQPGGGPPRPQGFKFTYEFPYVRGAASFEADTLADLGIRFKGNGTYMMSAGGIKRPFRLDFNRFTDGGQYRGLKALSLSNNVMDASRIREAAAYDAFRAAGVPAPRTTFVELALQVPGRFDHQTLGLYTAVEPIDKTFLKRHFKNAKGLLLKPENLRNGLEYFGEEWKPYAEMYGAKSEPTDAEKRRLIALARLINRSDDAAFQKEIGSYLDIDNFLRFLATTAFLAHYDSFIGFGHNYLLYLNPET